MFYVTYCILHKWVLLVLNGGEIGENFTNYITPMYMFYFNTFTHAYLITRGPVPHCDCEICCGWKNKSLSIYLLHDDLRDLFYNMAMSDIVMFCS